MPSISLVVISAVQNLYFIVAAPALFLPLGIVLLRSPILPSVFAYTAILLSVAFATVGAIFMLTLTLPAAVTPLGAVQALWWLAAAITLALAWQDRHRAVISRSPLSQARSEASAAGEHLHRTGAQINIPPIGRNTPGKEGAMGF